MQIVSSLRAGNQVALANILCRIVNESWSVKKPSRCFDNEKTKSSTDVSAPQTISAMNELAEAQKWKK